MKTYSAIQITNLAKSIRKDEASYKWLIFNNCIELAALSDCLLYGNYRAKRWLKRNNFEFLGIFLKALNNDTSKSFDYLKNHNKEWAATINASDNSKNAFEWLEKSNYPHFIELAKAIISVPRAYDDYSWFDLEDAFLIGFLFIWTKKHYSGGEKWPLF